MSNTNRGGVELKNEQIRREVEQLRNWMNNYGPLTSIEEEEIPLHHPMSIWGQVSDNYRVVLQQGLTNFGESIFVSTTPWGGGDHDLLVTTALYVDCRYCVSDGAADDSELLQPDPQQCLCRGHQRLFIDLEELLVDESDEAIEKALEPANLN